MVSSAMRRLASLAGAFLRSKGASARARATSSSAVGAATARTFAAVIAVSFQGHPLHFATARGLKASKNERIGSASLAVIGLAAERGLHLPPKAAERFGQFFAPLGEAGPWHRDGHGNRTTERVEDGNADGADPGIMFTTVKSKMVTARLLD